MHYPSILSLDIDYFVSPIAYEANSDGDRLSDKWYTVRPENEVRQFLEQHCRLSTLDRTRGDVITHHDEAFDKIKEAFEFDLFTNPVDLYHVDAHWDINANGFGCGWGEIPYLLGELMHKPSADRSTVLRGNKGLDCSNWLTFCVANRWIHGIHFLRHEDNNNDCPCLLYFPNTYSDANTLQKMELVPISDAETFFNLPTFKTMTMLLRSKSRGEPAVPWWTLEEEQFFLPSKPDYVLVCQSPGFTPKKADVLLDIIRDYLA